MVQDKDLIEQLNSLVVNNFNEKDFSNVWLAILDIVNWEKFKCIYITGQKDKDAEYNDIDNHAFIESFPNSNILNYDQIKNKIIVVNSTEILMNLFLDGVLLNALLEV